MQVGVVRALLALGVVLALQVRAVAGAGPRDAPRVVLEVRRDAEPARPGGGFADVAAAFDSITDASAAKPYLVRLMPGVHAVPVRGIALKPFVDLEGSGPEATVLEGAVVAGVPLWSGRLAADLPAVVRMAPNSRLRRLTVRNTSTAGGIAVYFPMTANAGAEDVTAEALGVMTPGMQYDYQAIRVEGPGADVILDRVTARYRMEVPPGATLVGDNTAIGVFHSGKLLVKNSRAIAENGWWNTGIASEGGSECVVLDSIIEVSGRAEGAYAFIADGTRDEARKTSMTVDCPANNSWGCAAIYACADSEVGIHESVLRVIVAAQTIEPRLLRCGGTIFSSRLTGPAAYDDWKLVDCTDGESRPIPNQP